MTETVPEEFLMIYRNIEKEVVDLSYKITFDEKQKNVYSTFIGELELRIFTLIESVAKFEGSDKQNYDEFFFNKFNNENSKPRVFVTMNSYKLSKKDYSDVFEMIEKRVVMVKEDGDFILDTKGRVNCKYNNAYQNLRHNFVNSLSVFGTIEYLFESLAALFVVIQEKASNIFAMYELTDDGKKNFWQQKSQYYTRKII